jgi:2-dehydro-3-deoxy-D-arabinonate dehydratase
MKLYKTPQDAIIEHQGAYYRFPMGGDLWETIVRRDDLHAFLLEWVQQDRPIDHFDPASAALLAPIGPTQEVWAAGVTYYRSRDARMEESKAAGGGSFYDKVYNADRPELFFKASPRMVLGTGQDVRIRRDSKWNVPEPELTLCISSGGKIVGYTIGNDMSSRDIEGENPLYLPQAKVYDGCCALGPAILVSEDPISKSTQIRIEILRGGERCFSGSTTLAELKRDPKDLVSYLFRESSFPSGCFLMTGTGIIPDSSFTLAVGDVIRITIDPIGTLENRVAS